MVFFQNENSSKLFKLWKTKKISILSPKTISNIFINHKYLLFLVVKSVCENLSVQPHNLKYLKAIGIFYRILYHTLLIWNSFINPQKNTLESLFLFWTPTSALKFSRITLFQEISLKLIWTDNRVEFKFNYFLLCPKTKLD